LIIPNNWWRINEVIINIDFFTCVNNPPALTEREPPPSSLISTNALIIAGKLLIIESIAPHLESHRVKPHNFNVEDLTKIRINENKLHLIDSRITT
jgi:hypothetical protein